MDRQRKQAKGVRLPVAVEVERTVHAPLEHLVHHEVEGMQKRQVVPDAGLRTAVPEELQHAFRRDLFRNHGVVRRVVGDEREVQAVALVARAAVRDRMERNLLHGASSAAVRTVTRVGTRSRSTRWLLVRMRGVTRQRAPPVPAVPQQSSASTSRAKNRQM